MTMEKWKMAGALALGLVCSGTWAADPNLGRNLAAGCAGCHGTDGNSVGGTASLAGMPRDRLLALIGEFRSGAKPATIMHQISKGYSDDQLALIADYFASRKPAGGER
jgi:cytochrome c553